MSIYAIFNDQSFNDTLTNDVVCYEQLGPECLALSVVSFSRFLNFGCHQSRTDWQIICILMKRLAVSSGATLFAYACVLEHCKD